jgi:hypothetical protein
VHVVAVVFDVEEGGVEGAEPFHRGSFRVPPLRSLLREVERE